MAGTPTSVTGSRVSDDLIAEEDVRDVSDVIQMLVDDRKSITTYMNAMRTMPVSNPKYEWFQDEIPPKTGTVGGAGHNDSVTTLDFSGLSANVYVAKDSHVKIPATGEIVRVTATPSNANSVSVERGVNGIAAAIPSGAQWTEIGDAREEGSSLYTSGVLDAISTTPVQDYNFTQTLRTAVGTSRRQKKRKLYSAKGNDFERTKVKALLKHLEKIEHALVHGDRSNDGSVLTGRTTTGGQISFIPSGNRQTVNPLTEAEFEDFVLRISRYGNSSKRTLFCSRYVAALISSWGRERQRITSPGKVKHGVQITEYLAGCGVTVEIVPAHVLEGRPGHSTRGIWDGYGMLLDMEGKGLAVYGGDKLTWQPNQHPNDTDGEAGDYLSDVGLVPGDGRKDGLLLGVAS